MIHYLKHNEIDFTKWDDCVANADNELIYATSFFLNAVCQWDALILDDYAAVMPLPKRKKWSITYVYNPTYAGQLGVFGKSISSKLIVDFINAIPLHFKYVQLHLNEFISLDKTRNILVKARTNYVLNVTANYQKLFSSFTKDARKNIRQAQKNELKVQTNIPVETVFGCYKKMYGKHLKGSVKKDFLQFATVCKNLIEAKKGFAIGVINSNSEIVSGSFWGIDNNRLYYLLGAPTPAGKKLGATYFMINHIIEKYAGSNLLLDFEGSDIPSVAAFYKQFVPQKKTYQLITINRLPRYLKWLKQ
jgi:hypothetical protein